MVIQQTARHGVQTFSFAPDLESILASRQPSAQQDFAKRCQYHRASRASIAQALLDGSKLHLLDLRSGVSSQDDGAHKSSCPAPAHSVAAPVATAPILPWWKWSKDMAPRVDLAPCVPGELIQSNQTFVEEQRVARPFREEDLLAPSRGFLDDARVFKRDDVYIGRGSKQRGLGSSIWGNPFKVKEHGLQEAVRLFRVFLANDAKLKSEVPKLTGKRLLCHCKLGDACHGDVLIECFIQLHPRAYVVGVTAEPPSEAVALAAARAREECAPDTDTDFDEDAAPPGSGWRGRGEPLWTGRAGKARELQDGAGLCSPGRWRVEDRRYPSCVQR